MKSIFTSPIRFLMIIVSAIALTACSKPPVSDVEVTLYTNGIFGNVMYHITATDDTAMITDIVINRGNCKINKDIRDQLIQGVNLSFGQTWIGWSLNCTQDTVKEMVVTTGKGTFTFTF